MRWRRAATLAAAVCVLEGVAVAVTPHVPPIFDGIGQPDEPYRWVSPPAGSRPTKPATVASMTVPVAHGRLPSSYTINSAESGPQVSVFIPAGGVATDPAATRVTIRAAPVAAPPGAAVPGHAWSNVYRLTVTADVGAARLTGGKAEIQMRAPTGQQPGPTFYLRTSSDWASQTTHRTGNDVYEATAPAAGYYVLASDRPFDVNAPDPSNEAAVGIIGFIVSGVGVLLVIVLFVRAERRRSARRAAARTRAD